MMGNLLGIFFESAFGGVDDLVKGDVVLLGAFPAVLEFGSGVADVAVDARDFYANVAELGVDIHGLARQRPPLRAVSARAKSRGLSEHEVHQRGRVARTAEEREQHARANA